MAKIKVFEGVREGGGAKRRRKGSSSAQRAAQQRFTKAAHACKVRLGSRMSASSYRACMSKELKK